MPARWIQRIFISGLAACLMGFHAFAAAPKTLTDVEAKLVIIHAFLSHYTSWPGNYAINLQDDIAICSMGEDAVVSQLALMENASTPSLKVRVLNHVSTKQLTACHVLYVADNQIPDLAAILAAARRYPILTVSAIGQFIEAGGMVELETEVKHQGNFEKHYVRYSLNLGSLARAKLNVLPDALELAKKVVRQ